MSKQKGRIDLMTSFARQRVFDKATRVKTTDESGEQMEGRGAVRRKSVSQLKESIKTMEHPAVWVWYPWRMNPEPPSPHMPLRRALKNLHGAVYSELSPVQRKNEDLMHHGVGIDTSKHEARDAMHPFLATILRTMDGKPKGFPLWFKRYPTRRHAYAQRFSIPTEMLDGYGEHVKAVLAPSMMTVREKEAAQRAMYMERYATHDLDTTSPVVVSAMLALRTRSMRNHLLTNPHNNVVKRLLYMYEQRLNRALRRLRHIDFRRYWEVVRDHDIQDIIQPTNLTRYRWGAYWRYDWTSGLAISTNIADFMDPVGLNGCVETGRSRAEVARDLGLSYSRPLNDAEQRQLSHHATYYEKLQKFKQDHPEVAREKDRQRFIQRFTGVYALMNFKSQAVDFPSRYRRFLGTRVTRWKSARHGPM